MLGVVLYRGCVISTQLYLIFLYSSYSLDMVFIQLNRKLAPLVPMFFLRIECKNSLLFILFQGLRLLTNEIDQFNLSYVFIGGEKNHIRSVSEKMGLIYEKILQVRFFHWHFTILLPLNISTSGQIFSYLEALWNLFDLKGWWSLVIVRPPLLRSFLFPLIIL